MGKIKVYHGTPNLTKILEADAILCPALSMIGEDVGRKVYEFELRRYNTLVADFAEMVKKRREETGKDFEHEKDFERANNSYEALADIVGMNPIYFDASIEDGFSYKEKVRNLHVFLSDYAGTSNHATGDDRAVLECSLPEETIRKGLPGRLTLVREKIPLEHVTAIYADKKIMDVLKSELKEKGYEIPVKDIAVPP